MAAAIIAVAIGRRASEVNDRCSWRLIEHELVISERHIYIQLNHVQSDVVLFLWPPDFNVRREQYAVVVLILAVTRVGDEGASLIVNELPVG